MVRFTSGGITRYASVTFGCRGRIMHLHALASEASVLLIRPPGKSGAADWYCPGVTRFTEARFSLNYNGEMVRQAGNAPASSVWKTEILLLNDWRI